MCLYLDVCDFNFNFHQSHWHKCLNTTTKQLSMCVCSQGLFCWDNKKMTALGLSLSQV